MATMRVFSPHDLLDYNSINLDPLTATYDVAYYLTYMATWPDYNYTMEHPDGSLIGYVLGKAEGPRGSTEADARKRLKWHGHVTAVTVTPEFRRMNVGVTLMKMLEEVTEKIYAGSFVDLFVRESNPAVQWYENQGYKIYRRVLEYYQDPGAKFEHGLDMRKAMLAVDPRRLTETPLGRDITFEELDSTL